MDIRANGAGIEDGSLHILGYDPGGNGTHGVAALRVIDRGPVGLETSCAETAREAFDWLAGFENRVALGVDTLLAWSGSVNGCREADRALRRNYKACEKSIVTPNGLFGAMSISGPYVATLLVGSDPSRSLKLFETHPKVLYLEKWKSKYNWKNDAPGMIENLRQALFPASVELEMEEHEFDAALSAYVAFEALYGGWELNDLYSADRQDLVFPAGQASYPWPVSLKSLP